MTILYLIERHGGQNRAIISEREIEHNIISTLLVLLKKQNQRDKQNEGK